VNREVAATLAGETPRVAWAVFDFTGVNPGLTTGP
jgi:hypothetical protein